MNRKFIVLVVLCLAFAAWIVPQINAQRKVHRFHVLPSGDLKNKDEKESAEDLREFADALPLRGKDHCSHGVRDAIEAEYGVDIFRGARAEELERMRGKNVATLDGMHRMLIRNGYEMVPTENYIPQKGDVQCILYSKIKEKNGKTLAHAQYYDGRQWISDHKQPCSYSDDAYLKKVQVTPEKMLVWTYRRKQ